MQSHEYFVSCGTEQSLIGKLTSENNSVLLTLFQSTLFASGMASIAMVTKQ